jgi:hypothetical protein
MVVNNDGIAVDINSPEMLNVSSTTIAANVVHHASDPSK